MIRADSWIMYITISDNSPCQVRRLRFLELQDNLEQPLTGPFLYRVPGLYSQDGEPIVKPYLWREWDTPPALPTADERDAPEGSAEWWAWAEHQLYWAAFHYETVTVNESTAAYLTAVAHYILDHCLDPNDRERIVTPADYTAVYHAALVPEISLEDIQQSLSRIYHATFDGKPVLDLLFQDEEEGGARLAVLRAWEVDAISKSGLSEAAWAELSVPERARRIVSRQLDTWLGYLAGEKAKREKVR